MKKKRPYRFKPCPDQIKGQRCEVCGGAYLCLQSWRKDLTKDGKRKQLEQA